MSSGKDLDYYIEKIKAVFENPDYYQAHKEVVPYMKEMSENGEILFEILRMNLLQPGYFESRYWGPLMGFKIAENKNFTLGVNVFLPRSKTQSLISTQSIHHHGNLLLTVVGAFGKGYEAIIFKPGFTINDETKKVSMEADKVFRNDKGYVSFVDAYSPHVVFFPESLNLSYSVWSKNKKQAVHALKTVGILQRNKAFIKKILKSFGLLKTMGLQADMINYDFYPENGVIRQLQNRIDYGRSVGDAFTQNTFFILQEVGFMDTDFWKKKEATLTPGEKKWTDKWALKWLNKEKIECYPDAVDIDNPKINFTKEELLKCFPPIKKEQIAPNV